MRLFVAVVPPRSVLEHLAGVEEPWHERVDGVSWVPSERRHVTLAFLGEVDEPVVPPLSAGLAAAAAGAGPMRLRLARGGRFGDRVLLAHLAGDVAALGALADGCAAAAARCGIRLEDRAFRAHLTLARARVEQRRTSGSGRPPRVPRPSLHTRPVVVVADALAGYEGPWWTADALTLFRSHLGPHPSHEPLGEWRLGEG